jgi:hypothetical protein
MNCPPENLVVYFSSHWFDPMIQIAHLKRPAVAASAMCVFVCSH